MTLTDKTQLGLILCIVRRWVMIIMQEETFYFLQCGEIYWIHLKNFSKFMKSFDPLHIPNLVGKRNSRKKVFSY